MTFRNIHNRLRKVERQVPKGASLWDVLASAAPVAALDPKWLDVLEKAVPEDGVVPDVIEEYLTAYAKETVNA